MNWPTGAYWHTNGRGNHPFFLHRWINKVSKVWAFDRSPLARWSSAISGKKVMHSFCSVCLIQVCNSSNNRNEK